MEARPPTQAADSDRNDLDEAREDVELVYRVIGDRALSGPAAVGPWDASMQHGAAPAGLVAWAAERVASERPMLVTRMTVDLMRPVPVAPLQIESSVLREGRKIQIVSVRLLADGVEVVRASVLKIRVQAQNLGTGDNGGALPYEPPEDASPLSSASSPSPFIDGVSMRGAGEYPPGTGRQAIWYRLNRAIIEGQSMSPLMRAAATADFTNGTAGLLDPTRWSFINADLSLQLVRQPAGEWILLEAEMWLSSFGSAVANGRLSDRAGLFGRSSQSLVIEPRDQRKD